MMLFIVVLGAIAFVCLPPRSQAPPTCTPVLAADLVLGQPDFESAGANRVPGCQVPSCAGPPAADTLSLDLARFVFDNRGSVWVSDKENDRVLRYDPPFACGMRAALVLGQPDFESNGTLRPRPTDADTLNGPLGLALDRGRLWVADVKNCRVLRFDPPFRNGMRAAVVLGQPDFRSGGNNRSGLFGRTEPVANGFSYPQDVAIDPEGNLWVCELENHRIVCWRAPIDESGSVPGARASAAAVMGQPDFRSGGKNRGRGRVPGAVRADGLNNPVALAFDLAGDIWVCDGNNHRVLRFRGLTAWNEPVPGSRAKSDFVLGQETRFGHAPGTGQRGMKKPAALGFDRNGRLWVADSANHRVLRYDLSAAKADMVIGQPDFMTTLADRGRTDPGARGLGRPNGLGVDPAGNIWTAEHNNDRVLRFRVSP